MEAEYVDWLGKSWCLRTQMLFLPGLGLMERRCDEWPNLFVSGKM